MWLSANGGLVFSAEKVSQGLVLGVPDEEPSNPDS
jgi:hypothetical protein